MKLTDWLGNLASVQRKILEQKKNQTICKLLENHQRDE